MRGFLIAVALAVGCGPSAGDPKDDSTSTTSTSATVASDGDTATSTSGSTTAATGASTNGNATDDGSTGSASTGQTGGPACGASTCAADEVCVVHCCGSAGCCFHPFRGDCPRGTEPETGQCGPVLGTWCLTPEPPGDPSCVPMGAVTCDADGVCVQGSCSGQMEAGVLTCECPW